MAVDRRVDFSFNVLQIIILTSSVLIILAVTFFLGFMAGKRSTGSTSFLEKDIKSETVKMRIESPPASPPSPQTSPREEKLSATEDASSKPVMTFYDTLMNPNKRDLGPVVASSHEETRIPSAETGNSKKKYTIQVGAVKEKASADTMIAKLKKSGYSAYLNPPGPSGRNGLYKVRLGTFSSRNDALKEAERIKKNEGLSAMVVEK